MIVMNPEPQPQWSLHFTRRANHQHWIISPSDESHITKTWRVIKLMSSSPGKEHASCSRLRMKLRVWLFHCNFPPSWWELKKPLGSSSSLLKHVQSPTTQHPECVWEMWSPNLRTQNPLLQPCQAFYSVSWWGPVSQETSEHTACWQPERETTEASYMKPERERGREGERGRETGREREGEREG